MNTDSNIYNNVSALIEKSMLTDAITMLKQNAGMRGKKDILPRLDEIEKNYRYLRQFALNNSKDPSRAAQLQAIKGELYRINDSLDRSAVAKTSSSEYFSTLRFEATRPQETVSQLVSGLRQESDPRIAMSKAARLFRRVWITYPLQEESCKALFRMYVDNGIPSDIKSLLISAILLGTLEYYDVKKLELLLNIYLVSAEDEPEVRARAITAIVLILLSYGNRAIPSRVMEELIAACSEIPVWKEDVNTAYIYILRTIDTPRISSKILDELVPGLMKLRPEIERRMPDLENIGDMEDLEENPQWEELLSNSGLSEQMRQMAEIQQEGGDVFMSTFSHLKGFPFFREISGWFLPFSPHHPELASLAEDSRLFSLLEKLTANAPFLCNSDKYSLALSLKQMPESQRTMLTGQLGMAAEASREETSAELYPDDVEAEKRIHNYVLDLYRFFNLYSRKDEFKNPFSQNLDITSSATLSSQFAAESGTIAMAAEFCFRHKYYPLALKLYGFMESGGVFTEELFQKTGFSFQALGQFELALEAYRKAELLDGDNKWTLKKIASCLAATGNHAEAVAYYRRLLEDDSENVALTRAYLRSAIAVRDAETASALLARLDYYSPSARNLKFSSLISQIKGNIPEAEKAMSAFLAEGGSGVTSDDYLMHAALATLDSDFLTALDSLMVARASGDIQTLPMDKFIKKFHEKLASVASRAGVSKLPSDEMFALLIDSIPR